jgi:hypothetical protein
VHDGLNLCPVVVGIKSMFTSIYCMQIEPQFPGILIDFIRNFGDKKGSFTDSTKSEIRDSILSHQEMALVRTF